MVLKYVIHGGLIKENSKTPFRLEDNGWLLIQPDWSSKPTMPLLLQSFKVKWAVCFTWKPSWKKAYCGEFLQHNFMQFENEMHLKGFKEIY